MRFYKSETADPIRERLQAIISERLGLTRERVGSSSSFLGDLGADSLDIAQLVMALEETFDLSIPEDDLRRMLTVGDVVDYIIRNGP